MIHDAQCVQSSCLPGVMNSAFLRNQTGRLSDVFNAPSRYMLAATTSLLNQEASVSKPRFDRIAILCAFSTL
jgi:hypothetical protein